MSAIYYGFVILAVVVFLFVINLLLGISLGFYIVPIGTLLGTGLGMFIIWLGRKFN